MFLCFAASCGKVKKGRAGAEDAASPDSKGQINMQTSFTPAPPEKQGKEVIAPASHEPGKVPSHVPSADLEKRFYQHYKLWNRRAA